MIKYKKRYPQVIKKCPTCGHVYSTKATCADCTFHFTTPFDDNGCEKGRTGKVLCKEFEENKD